MNRFLKYWRLTGRGEAFHAHVSAYADDFVILSRGCSAEALAWTKAVMTRLGLTLNEAKTSLKNARQERFDFLGYSFGPHRYKANGLWYLSASPSKKSVQRFKTKIGNLLVPGNNDPWPEVRDTLNRSLLGWSNYFCHGTRQSAFHGIDRYVYERVRDFLARRHKIRRPFWRGETGAAWIFHGSDGSAGAPWLSIHLCRCGLAFTVCLGVVTPVASWCSMVQRDAPWCNGATARRSASRVLRVTCHAGDVRCRP